MSKIRNMIFKRALRRERSHYHWARAAIRAEHSLGGVPEEFEGLPAEEYKAAIQAEAIRRVSDDRRRSRKAR